MIARFFKILLVPLLFSQCVSKEKTQQLVVEASIRSGEPVENISVRLVDKHGLEHAKPVSNADVRLLSQGVTYLLNEIAGKPGFYGYYGSDLEIVSGQEYMLWVQHEDAVAVTSTVIKADTLVKGEIENGLGYFVAKE
ncbi:MAG: DUF4249 family protein [Cytophagales bacterium]|nr:DUF4249 family protein [Cytophagales bacterium]